MHTTKWRVLRPHLPEAASRTIFALPGGQFCATCFLHRVLYKLPLLRDTLVGHLVVHSCGTLLYDTFAGRSCRTFLSDTLVGHSCRTLLWDALAGHSCGTLLSDTPVGHSCRTLLWDTLSGLSCRPLVTLSVLRVCRWCMLDSARLADYLSGPSSMRSTEERICLFFTFAWQITAAKLEIQTHRYHNIPQR